MPDETLITEIENILTEVVRIGGEQERTSIIPNLTVQDASPAGLTGFIIVSDDRDGDNILAKKVPSVVYADNDLVNVMFVKGGEAIAFQQGSQSGNSGMWEIVSGTSTDIYYDKGKVGIGTTGPDAELDILNTAGAQLRLTHTDGSKFADVTLDTNHDFTIDPSSTGQIILASDDVTIGEDLIHSGDTDTKITFTDDQIALVAGNETLLTLIEGAQDEVQIGDGGDVDIDFNADMFLEGSSGDLTIGSGTALGYGLVSIVSNGNAKIPLVIREKSGGTANLTEWQDTAGTTITSVSDVGILFTSTSSATTGSGIGGISIELQNRNSTAGNYMGFIGKNSNGDNLGAYQFIADSQVAGTGSLRMGIFSAGGYFEVMRITNSQRIGMTVTSPAAKLDIHQNGPGAGIPVIGMEQDDVDEPFMKMTGTAAAATLTRSIVDEGDVTTATRIGWAKIEIQDDGNQVTDGDYFVPFYTLA